MNERNSEGVSLGAYLRCTREQAGLTLRQLAEMAEVNYAYLARLETGEKTNPSAEILLGLAEALKLESSELLAFIGIKPTSTLPSTRTYFRRKFGVNAKKADVLARLVEEQLNRGGEESEETDKARDE